MKWEITKGSEKDFEGAPEWATLLTYTGGVSFFVEEHRASARLLHIDTRVESKIEPNPMPNQFDDIKIIAERRPITEPVVTTKWNGEFPIAAGINVEVHFSGDYSRLWTEFRVEYMRGDVVVLYDYRSDSVVSYSNEYLSFRPIRSADDVARDEAALDLFLTINFNDTEADWVALGARRNDYYKAIDAGYRKME